MPLLPPPAWTRTYRTMTFDDRACAAEAVYCAYFDACWVAWFDLVSDRKMIPAGQPGPCDAELVIITMPRGYVVHQTLNGWPAAHVVTIRWRAPWERYLEALNAA